MIPDANRRFDAKARGFQGLSGAVANAQSIIIGVAAPPERRAPETEGLYRLPDSEAQVAVSATHSADPVTGPLAGGRGKSPPGLTNSPQD